MGTLSAWVSIGQSYRSGFPRFQSLMESAWFAIEKGIAPSGAWTVFS